MAVRVPLKIIYNKRNKLNKEGKAPIIIEAYFSRSSRKPINLNISIEPRQWNSKQLKVVKHSHDVVYNSIINSTINNIEDYQGELIKKGKSLSPELLHQFLTNLEHGGSAACIMRAELEKQNDLSQGTYRGYASFINTFDEFRPNITFTEINYDVVQTYDRYLRSKGFTQSTIHKRHKMLSKFIQIAIKKNIISHEDNPYLHFKKKAGEPKKDALTIDEVIKLEKLPISESDHGLTKTRDIFLFCCYTGLRYSDMQSLRKDEVTIDTKGKYHVNFEMEKVERANYLPLSVLFNGKAVRIIEKYLHEGKRETIFPKITNQALNRSLKSLGLVVNPKVKFSSHLGRHTFGTMLADITGNPIVIKSLMGHKNIETSMIYIHMSNERLIKQLEKQDWSIFE